VALGRADPLSKESYRLCVDEETEKSAKVYKGCRAMDGWMDRWIDRLSNSFLDEIIFCGLRYDFQCLDYRSVEGYSRKEELE
jgi:hypothetical protein